MEYISINFTDGYPEDFLFAKVDIEKKMIEDGKIEKRMKIEDFFTSLDIQNSIYMKDQKGIAFSIQEGLDDSYIFYHFLDEEDDELFESFKKKLEKMKYSISKDSLTKPEPMQLLDPDFLSKELFMLDFEIYV